MGLGQPLDNDWPILVLIGSLDRSRRRHWFDIATYHANWNTSTTTDSHAIVKSILLCLCRFVGVESAAVSFGMVKNPGNAPYRWQPCWVRRAGGHHLHIAATPGYRRDVPSFRYGLFRRAVRYPVPPRFWVKWAAPLRFPPLPLSPA